MGGMASNISSVVSNTTPKAASGGKSAPPTQNNYSPSFGSQSAAPTSAAPPSGGKSSGLGQSGYGTAPAFEGPTRQDMSSMGGKLLGGGMPMQSGFNQGFNQAGNPNMGSGLTGFSGVFSPEALAFQQANPQNAEANRMAQNAITGMQGDIAKQTNNMQQNQGMPMQGGKSSGLGQSGYGAAPGFGGQQLGGLASQRQMQGGFGPQAPTQDAFNGFRAMTGSPMNFDQFSQSRGGGFNQQPRQQFQQPQFNPFQQQFGGFQQQPQFNPFQQQQQFQQQPQGASGLQALFNNMMNQQQQMQRQSMQRMPRFQSQALQYRPNMQNAQAALSRVQPSVQKQGQDAQAARIAELEAQIAAFQPQTPTDYGNNGG
jgi:hypothetical protein